MPMSKRSASRSRSRSRAASRGRKRARSSYGRDDSNLSAAIIRKPSYAGQTYTFRRWADMPGIWNTTNSESTGTVITAGSPDIISEMYTMLSVLPNASDFQALFSQYRITEMEFHFINNMYTDIAGSQSGVSGSNQVRNFAVYIGQQKDVLGFKTINQMQQEEGVTIRDYVNNGKPLIIKVKKPTINMSAQDSTATGVIAVETSGEWIDTAVANIPYRGVFLGCQEAFFALGSPNTAARAYTVRVRLTIEFRGVR